MLAAGRLRRRVVIERLTVELDPDTGVQSDSWQQVFARAMSAEIRPLSGRELIAAQAVQSKVTTRIVIRHRDGIVPSMRARERGTAYNIEAVVPDDETGRRWLTLHCTSGVNAG